MQVVSFKTENQKAVEEILTEADAKKFDSVILLGWKDGTISINVSGINDRVKMIGSLEVAKTHLWTYDD